MSISPFQYVNNATRKDPSGEGYEYFMVNRVISCSMNKIFLANIFNDYSFSKLSEATKKQVVTKYLNSIGYFKYKYVKATNKTSAEDEELILKLSELLKCPYRDAKRYIEDELYSKEEILETYRIERD